MSEHHGKKKYVQGQGFIVVSDGFSFRNNENRYASRYAYLYYLKVAASAAPPGTQPGKEERCVKCPKETRSSTASLVR